MNRAAQERLLALQEALGELLASAGLPARRRQVDKAPYRCTLPPPAAGLSAVRVPIAREASPGAGLRLRVTAAGHERTAELSPTELRDRDAALFSFQPLPAGVSELAELELSSSGAGAPAILLLPSGRPAFLLGHGESGAVARPRRPPLLSRDNWLEAARLLRQGGPLALGARVLRRLTRPPPPPRAAFRDRYPEWLAAHALPTPLHLDEWRAQARAAGDPRLAVLLLPGPGDAAASRASLAAQHLQSMLIVNASAGDGTITWPAIDADYFVPLRPGDRLAPHALLRFAAASAGRPALITCDEDVVRAGARTDPFFKPSLTLSRLRCEDYVAGAAAFRVDPTAGATPLASWEGALWDAALRRAEAGPCARVEDVLLQRAGPRRAAPVADARLLLSAAAQRAGWAGAEPRAGRVPGSWRLAPVMDPSPAVSVVIPFRDLPEVLDQAIRSIRATSLVQLELVLADNGSVEPATKALLARLASEGARVVPQPGPFNYARINNQAAKQARGEYLLFLNNDIEAREAGWLQALLEQAVRPEVGAVGARLLFPEGPVQHAGVVLGLGGVAGHVGRLLPPASGGYHRSFDVVHDYSAVTAACLLMRRALFEELGGFDERLAVSFNDVDLCLRIRARGLQVVYTPFAELIHHESLSRGPRVDQTEIALMRSRWGAVLERDPYYNRSLSLQRDDYEVQP